MDSDLRDTTAKGCGHHLIPSKPIIHVCKVRDQQPPSVNPEKMDGQDWYISTMAFAMTQGIWKVCAKQPRKAAHSSIPELPGWMETSLAAVLHAHFIDGKTEVQER